MIERPLLGAAEASSSSSSFRGFVPWPGGHRRAGSSAARAFDASPETGRCGTHDQRVRRRAGTGPPRRRRDGLYRRIDEFRDALAETAGKRARPEGTKPYDSFAAGRIVRRTRHPLIELTGRTGP